jgi:5-methylcytosine-specific restriction endonuclease McrA
MAKRPYIHVKVQKQGKVRDHYMCFICATVGARAEGHHMLLHSEDGPEIIENIVTLCKPCHTDYHAGRLPVTFYLKDIS